ncbi:MAG: hypothetical protein LUC97_11345 [Clostridiales bacterium]|nr:hypothetical protein [Clostridiales bacterium]
MAKKISAVLIGILILALWAAVFVYCSKAVRNNSENNVEIVTYEDISETNISETVSEETTQTITYYNENVPESVWAELQQKTGLTEKELSNELKKYESLKNSKSYSWDNSEAPLTDEQIKEIEAEQASILAEINAAETTEELTETTTISETTEIISDTPETTATETTTEEISETATEEYVE